LTDLEYPDGNKVYYTYNNIGQIVGVANWNNENPAPPAPPEIPKIHYKLNDNSTSNNTIINTGSTTTNAQLIGVATTQGSSQTGKIVRTLNLDGKKQHIDAGTSVVNQVKTDTTGALSFWMKADVIPTSNVSLHSITNSQGNGRLIVSLTSTGRIDVKAVNDSNATQFWCWTTQTGLIAAGQWRHVAVVQNGTQVKIYVGGQEKTLTFQGQTGAGKWFSSFGNLNTMKLHASQYNAGAVTAFYDGSIDDFRYYPRALSASEVGLLYNGGNGTEEETVFSSSTPATQTYVSDVNYNALGQITEIDYGSGAKTTYTYNPTTLRLTHLLTVNAAFTALQDLSYTYDSGGNILSITDGVNTASQTFQYDAINRLVNAAGHYGTKMYQYDTIGNIVSKDNKTYSYGAAGAGPHAVTALSDGTTFTYDDNGNMASKQLGAELWLYSYDVENRLITVTKNGSVIANYIYDGDGGRTKKIVTDPSGVVTTTRFLGSLFDSTTSTTNPTPKDVRYIFLGGSRVASINSSTLLYYHDDHLGGTNVLTDSVGTLKEIIEYEPFGSESRHDKLGNSDEVAWYYFTGKKKDDETGLLFFGARYYDPSIGRFITADSIVQAPSNPQTLNRYSYTSNNPINRIDPDGHRWSWRNFFRAVGIAIVGTVLAVVSGGALAPVIGAYWAGVATGAIAGATIGGAFSAATGGNIGMGLLTGAISGAIFGGIGGMGFTGLAHTAAHFVGGAISGAINGSITGGNIGLNALIGGISAGATEWASGNIDLFKLTGNYITDVVKRAALGGLVGGGISTSFGGSFGSGFKNGAMTAAISYTANEFNHQIVLGLGTIAVGVMFPEITVARVALGVLTVGATVYLSNRTPVTGVPDSKVEFPNAKGGGKTVRVYGPDGRAAKDVDYGHNHGAGDPHAHDWDGSSRGDGRSLTDEEKGTYGN